MTGNDMGMPPRTPPPPYPPNPAPPPDPWNNSRTQWKARQRALKAQQRQWRAQQKMQRVSYGGYYRRATRGSLVGPIMLVGVGVVALLMTLHRIDAAAFWQWYGHWWPLVLIGAGVVLALESLVFSSQNAHIRLGGGVVFLGLVLASIGVVAAHNDVNWTAVGDQLQLGDNFDMAQVFGKKHEATEQIVHALPANATLVIQNPRGDVTISTGNEDQMQLKLEKTIYTGSESEAAQKLRELEPLITTSGSMVTVHMPTSDSQIADMTLTLPASAAVQVLSEHGDVTIAGRQAAVTVNSNHGDVQLESIHGAVHAAIHQGDFSARSIQGDLTLAGRMNDLTVSQVSGLVALDGDFFGDVHLEHLQGPVHFHSSRTDLQVGSLNGSVSLDNGDMTIEKATGPVSVGTHAMDVELHEVSGDVRVHNANGDVEIEAADPMGSMNVENRNGAVEVTVPTDAKFSVEATAVDGEVHTDFNLATENGNRHSIVSGTVGGGGPLIHITAEKGDITLRKN
ncbi:MAG: DUF4097 family beta strand repeat-containing protein [Acidobacteriaceae bacterium]